LPDAGGGLDESLVTIIIELGSEVINSGVLIVGKKGQSLLT
jgi:hypothetical protein